MPEALLKFSLPDEDSEFQIAIKSMDWALVVWDLDQKLRKYLKYGHEFSSADDAIESIREHLLEKLEEYNLSFNVIN